jgi:hypothetical protein
MKKPLLLLCVLGLLVAIPIAQATISAENQSIVANDSTIVISVSIDIRPNTLHCNSKGQLVTCYIAEPVGYDYSVRDIDVTTILLQGLPVLPDKIGFIDHDLDGTCDLMVKFSRADLFALLPGFTWKDYPLMLTGFFEDGTAFSGEDLVNIVYN